LYRLSIANGSEGGAAFGSAVVVSLIKHLLRRPTTCGSVAGADIVGFVDGWIRGDSISAVYERIARVATFQVPRR
jgi:hypothetical protein